MRATVNVRSAVLLLCVAAPTVLGGASLAVAQASPAEPAPPPASSPAGETRVDPVELAREAFRAGVQAAKASDWPTAEREFLRSYELHPHPATLLNLAAVQAQTTRLADAVRTYKRYLRDTREVAEDDPQRSDARRAMKALSERVPAVTMKIKGARARRAAVALDDRALTAEDLREAVDVNPGEHEIVVRDGEIVVKRQAFIIAEGERLEVTVDLDEELAPNSDSTLGSGPRIGVDDGTLAGSPMTMSTDAESHDTSLWDEPWFWVGAGVAAAAIVGVVLAVSLGGSREATEGNVTPAGRLP